MQFRRYTLQDCEDASGAVVVIDVLRAFTTAPFALAGGVPKIMLVREVEEALALRARFAGARVMGEVDGLKPDSFDFGNSPFLIQQAALNGRLLIQRTSSGTQGVILSRSADVVLPASFVVAAATVRAIRRLAPAVVSFVITGVRPDGRGDEDAALADYLEAQLTGRQPAPAPYLQRVRDSVNGRHFLSGDPRFLPADVDCAVDLDRFDFALRAGKEKGLTVMQPWS